MCHVRHLAAASASCFWLFLLLPQLGLGREGLVSGQTSMGGLETGSVPGCEAWQCPLAIACPSMVLALRLAAVLERVGLGSGELWELFQSAWLCEETKRGDPIEQGCQYDHVKHVDTRESRCIF